jgi:hypothetical protein
MNLLRVIKSLIRYRFQVYFLHFFRFAKYTRLMKIANSNTKPCQPNLVRNTLSYQRALGVLHYAPQPTDRVYAAAEKASFELDAKTFMSQFESSVENTQNGAGLRAAVFASSACLAGGLGLGALAGGGPINLLLGAAIGGTLAAVAAPAAHDYVVARDQGEFRKHTSAPYLETKEGWLTPDGISLKNYLKG